MTLDELRGKQIAVLGLGENHKHLVRYFDKHKIRYTLIDKWQSDLDLDVLGFEVVFRTPGLRFNSKPIQEAASRGAQIYSQTKLFFDLCPAKIIGVSGTKGKGTTATLISKILEAAVPRQARDSKVYLAGNIGRDPFEFLDELVASDWVVLELSSFQLQDLHRSPHVAVMLKITPEHLDYHKDFEEYLAAKKSIVKFQSEKDYAVLNYDSEVTRELARETRAQIFWNSITQEVKPGCFVRGENIVLDDAPIMKVSEVGLIGMFNLENVTAAIAAAAAAGVRDQDAISRAVSEFRGLPHRLEFAAEIKGVRYYDDSFSTTPQTAMAALSVFTEPIILIAGGSEKNADYTELAETIAQKKVKSLLAIGITGPKIASAARKAGFVGKIYDTGLTDMEKIAAKADEITDPGDIVLLSPASASFDMFVNYKQRGELFKKFVNKLV